MIKKFKSFTSINEKASSIVHGNMYDILSFPSEDEELPSMIHVEAGDAGILGVNDVNIPWDVVKQLVEKFAK